MERKKTQCIEDFPFVSLLTKSQFSLPHTFSCLFSSAAIITSTSTTTTTTVYAPPLPHQSLSSPSSFDILRFSGFLGFPLPLLCSSGGLSSWIFCFCAAGAAALLIDLAFSCFGFILFPFLAQSEQKARAEHLI